MHGAERIIEQRRRLGLKDDAADLDLWSAAHAGRFELGRESAFGKRLTYKQPVGARPNCTRALSRS